MRYIKATGLAVCGVFMGMNAAIADVMPEYISEPFYDLIKESEPHIVDPKIYEFAHANQDWSDEMVCPLIQYFDKEHEIQSDMLRVVDDREQQKAVIVAVRHCMQEIRDDAFGASRLTSDDVQQSIQDTAENPEVDVSSPITPGS